MRVPILFTFAAFIFARSHAGCQTTVVPPVGFYLYIYDSPNCPGEAFLYETRMWSIINQCNNLSKPGVSFTTYLRKNCRITFYEDPDCQSGEGYHSFSE